MQIIEKIKLIQEAAERQGIVVTDILEDGTVVSDLPAFRRTYKVKLKEAFPDEDEDEKDVDGDTLDGEDKEPEDDFELELADEESKVDYDSKEAAAVAIVDNIILQDFDKAHEALEDYIALYQTDGAEGDPEGEEGDEVADDAEIDGEQAGTEDEYLMPADEEEEEEPKE